MSNVLIRGQTDMLRWYPGEHGKTILVMPIKFCEWVGGLVDEFCEAWGYPKTWPAHCRELRRGLVPGAKGLTCRVAQVETCAQWFLFFESSGQWVQFRQPVGPISGSARAFHRGKKLSESEYANFV